MFLGTVLFIFVFAAVGNATTWFLGNVNDGPAAADGHTVVAHYAHNPNITNSTIVVNNSYGIFLPDQGEGNIVIAEVIDNGDGYVAGPVNLTTTVNYWEEMPNMTLSCGVNYTRISVSTGDVYYMNVNTSVPVNITITGTLIRDFCNPISNRTITLTVDLNGTIFVDQQSTDENGTYSTMFSTDEDFLLGDYTVMVAFFEANETILNTTTFTLSACPDADGDTHFASFCGGTDCDDTNAGIYLGASETCENGIDEDCNGEDLVCETEPTPPPTGGGGGTLCNPDWVCTEWEECQEDGTQERTCTDDNNCRTNRNMPDTEQECVPAPPAPPSPPTPPEEGAGEEETPPTEEGAPPASAPGAGVTGFITGDIATDTGIVIVIIIIIIVYLLWKHYYAKPTKSAKPAKPVKKNYKKATARRKKR